MGAGWSIRQNVVCVSLNAESPMNDRILIIDFGSQVTQLIARRVRESGVYCEIHPFQSVTADTILAFDPKGIILSGGPASVTEATTPRAPDVLFNGLGLPVMGICYGNQTMVAQLGGRITLSDHREFGRAMVEVKGDCVLFDGVWKAGETHQVWMSHGDRIDALPDGFRVVADLGRLAVRRDRRRPSAASLASSSTPKWSTRRTGPRI